jgi:cephalosporin hydroxylase
MENQLKKEIKLDNEIKFNVQTISDGHHKVHYRGIKTIKNPFDYLLYQMIITELKPDLIIEIGTNHGGGALYMANLMDLEKNEMGEIHTIDIYQYPMSELVTSHHRIKRFLGGYQSYDLKNAEKFKNILVIDDGSHEYYDVNKCLEKFKDIVSVGSYFIVEDGIINEIGLENQYSGGPLKAIAEFINKNENYIIDRKWCDFFGKNATFNPNGFLKKI